MHRCGCATESVRVLADCPAGTMPRSCGTHGSWNRRCGGRETVKRGSRHKPGETTAVRTSVYRSGAIVQAIVWRLWACARSARRRGPGWRSSTPRAPGSGSRLPSTRRSGVEGRAEDPPCRRTGEGPGGTTRRGAEEGGSGHRPEDRPTAAYRGGSFRYQSQVTLLTEVLQAQAERTQARPTSWWPRSSAARDGGMMQVNQTTITVVRGSVLEQDVSYRQRGKHRNAGWRWMAPSTGRPARVCCES